MPTLNNNKICEGYEGHVCDVSLKGRHVTTKRCEPCAKAKHLFDKSASARRASDTFTVEGAQRLKRQIENYWAVRGRVVNVNFEKGRYTPRIRTAPTFIRSDLINGLPQTGATK